jgi:hypothetical protein
MTPPQYPVGSFVADERASSPRIEECIRVLEAAPAALRAAVAGASDAQLDTRYKNWTTRQIVHHIADSHVNSYIRFKWALTEDRPTIKAYDEGRWAGLDDSRAGSIDAPLALLDGLHHRWVQLLRTLSVAQFGRTFLHPESGEEIPLFRALGYYAWHSRHHTGQILWLRQHDWDAAQRV